MPAVGFADPIHGLLLLKRCPLRGCQVVAFATADGGRHWRQRGSLPAPARPFPVTLFTPDRRDAFVDIPIGQRRFAGYASRDGGRSWKPLDLPARAQLAAAAAGRVWAYSQHCRGQARVRCSGGIYAASVGGSGEFTRLSSPPTGGRPINALVASGATTVYLTAGLIEGADYRLLTSTDGGRSWSRAPNPCGRYDVGISAPASTSDTVWAICSSQPGAGNQLKRLFVSDDNATQWTRQAAPEGGGYAVDLDVTSAAIAWRSGSDRADIFRTSDGGHTWHDLLEGRVGESAGGAAYLFTATDSDHACVIVSGTTHQTTPRLLRTSDGGQTWTQNRLSL